MKLFKSLPNDALKQKNDFKLEEEYEKKSLIQKVRNKIEGLGDSKRIL